MKESLIEFKTKQGERTIENQRYSFATKKYSEEFLLRPKSTPSEPSAATKKYSESAARLALKQRADDAWREADGFS